MNAIQVQEPVTYNERTKMLPMRYSQCSCCGSEIASTTDLRENKRIVNEFKKLTLGFTTGATLKFTRQDIWKITQEQASEIFGGGPKAFSKYESDDVIQSEAMDKLLKLAINIPEAFAMLKEMSGEKVKQSTSVIVTNRSVEWKEVCIDSSIELPTTVDSPTNSHVGYTYLSAKSWSVKKVA
jgi:putative zinc finger/helix-turn-helix protein, YgiT family